MRKILRTVCAALLLMLVSMTVANERNLRIASGKRIELAIPGASVAFSHNPTRARVVAKNGVVLLAAGHPGKTRVVVVTPAGRLRLDVTVTPDSPQPYDYPLLEPREQPLTAFAGPAPPPESVVNVEGQAISFHEVRVKPVAESGRVQAEVQAGRSTRIQVVGATAALTVDDDMVDVSASEGVVQVSGRAPGRAEVLVVTPDGIRSLVVVVSPAPPVYPPGFVPPVAAAEESGSYELDYVSNPRQFQNRYDYTTTHGERTTQLHFVNVDFLDGITGNGNSDIPSGFFRMATRHSYFTLLDQNVRNSPLTVDEVIVRGLHLSNGDWTFHGGYSTLASFYNFLIPTQRETVFSISHAFQVTENSRLIQNAYYFPTRAQPDSAGRPGTVASLQYVLRRPRGLELLAELGYSHGFGSAGELQWSDQRNFLYVNFRQKPRNFAALSIGNLPGSMAELSWNRTISAPWLSAVNITENHVLLPTGEQTNLNATANLQYRLSRHLAVMSGATYSDFSQLSAGSTFTIHSLTLPQQINYEQKHFGAGLQYQVSKTSGSFSLGQDLRAMAHVGGSQFQATGFVERQTQALTVSSLYSQIPALQLQLQRMGLTAIDPAQLAALLQDNAFLLSLGLSQQAVLHLVPVRVQAGASFSWTSRGPRPQRLSLDFIHNNEQSLQGGDTNWIQNGNYTLPLTAANELNVSLSFFHYAALGQSQYSPQITVGLKHNFSGLPSFFAPGAHGTITGVVFVDPEMGGIYNPGMQTLANVVITLDGLNRSETNERGRYSFTHVPQGQHTIEASFKSSQPFWFTTASVVTTAINRTADFGITFASSELIGHVRNDAGLGLADVEIEITGPGGRQVAHTDADGRFAVAGLRSGEYQLVVDANTVPPGHTLEELRPLRIGLENGAPKSADFLVRALRTLFGQVNDYDPGSGEFSPIMGATVRIAELAIQATTDRLGKYIFRQLPAGHYTVTVTNGVFAQSRSLIIPATPAELQEDFRIPRSKSNQ